MKRGRHVEDVLPPRPAVVRGEARAALIHRGQVFAGPCDHDSTVSTCLGGHGRHVLPVVVDMIDTVPRHPAAWPSSSQAGLATLGGAR